MSAVTELDPIRFDEDVLGAETPVLLDFYSETCPPCQALKPVLEELAKRWDGKAKVLKLNVMSAYDLAVRFGIRGVPTILFFNNGDLIDGTVGLVPPQVLEGKLNALLAESGHKTTRSTGRQGG